MRYPSLSTAKDILSYQLTTIFSTLLGEAVTAHSIACTTGAFGACFKTPDSPFFIATNKFFRWEHPLVLHVDEQAGNALTDRLLGGETPGQTNACGKPGFLETAVLDHIALQLLKNLVSAGPGTSTAPVEGFGSWFGNLELIPLPGHTLVHQFEFRLSCTDVIGNIRIIASCSDFRRSFGVPGETTYPVETTSIATLDKLHSCAPSGSMGIFMDYHKLARLKKGSRIDLSGPLGSAAAPRPLPLRVVPDSLDPNHGTLTWGGRHIAPLAIGTIKGHQNCQLLADPVFIMPQSQSATLMMHLPVGNTSPGANTHQHDTTFDLGNLGEIKPALYVEGNFWSFLSWSKDAQGNLVLVQDSGGMPSPGPSANPAMSDQGLLIQLNPCTWKDLWEASTQKPLMLAFEQPMDALWLQEHGAPTPSRAYLWQDRFMALVFSSPMTDSALREPDTTDSAPASSNTSEAIPSPPAPADHLNITASEHNQPDHETIAEAYHLLAETDINKLIQLLRCFMVQTGGGQKAAASLIMLGHDRIVDVLSRVEVPEVETLTFEIARLDQVPRDLKIRVLMEARELLDPGLGGSFGGITYIREALEEARGSQEAVDIITRLTDSLVQIQPFDFMRRFDPHAVFSLLMHEPPRTWALILSFFDPDKSAIFLEYMAPSLRQAVFSRIGHMNTVSFELLRHLEKVLEARLEEVEQGHARTDGVAKLVELVNHMSIASSQKLFKSLQEAEPELATALEEQICTFGNLLDLTEDDLDLLLGEAELDAAAAALLLMDEQFHDEFMTRLRSNKARHMESALKESPVSDIAKCREAQKHIMDRLRTLVKNGMITLDRLEKIYPGQQDACP